VPIAGPAIPIGGIKRVCRPKGAFSGCLSRPILQELGARRRLFQPFGLGNLRGDVHHREEFVVVVVEVGKGRVDLLRPEIRMLAEDLFGSPPIVIVLSRQVQHFVPAPFDTGRAVGVESEAGILRCRVHDFRFRFDADPPLVNIQCFRFGITPPGVARALAARMTQSSAYQVRFWLVSVIVFASVARVNAASLPCPRQRQESWQVVHLIW
jgi:hypothetical protein